jgi:hypothetical protein
MQFAFKRDSDGRETVHVGDVAIARVTTHPEGFEWLSSPPAGVTAEHVREAAAKADEALFWHQVLLDWYTDEVTVDVSIAETTSTILSMTTEDER